MANPQVEEGFIKIANALWNEILRRDFTKRQQNIILLIWRLSYGCRKKDCSISKYNVFELAGLYKGDIKKELKFLRDCRVIKWDEETLIFSINKDYERWQITPSKNWDEEKLKSEIAANLKENKVSKTLTFNEQEKKKEVSKTLTKKYRLVSKTLTTKLVKHELARPSTLRAPRGTRAVKTVKNSIKDITTTTTENAFTFYEQNFGILTPYNSEKLGQWLDDYNDQDEILIMAMQIALDRNKRNWGYTESILIDWLNKGAKSLKDCQALQLEFKNNVAAPRSKTQNKGVDWEALANE